MQCLEKESLISYISYITVVIYSRKMLDLEFSNKKIEPHKLNEVFKYIGINHKIKKKVQKCNY